VHECTKKGTGNRPQYPGGLRPSCSGGLNNTVCGANLCLRAGTSAPQCYIHYRQICETAGWNPQFCWFINQLLDEWMIPADERNSWDLAELARIISVSPIVIRQCVAESLAPVVQVSDDDEDKDELMPSDASESGGDESEYCPSADEDSDEDELAQSDASGSGGESEYYPSADEDSEAGSKMDESADGADEDWEDW